MSIKTTNQADLIELIDVMNDTQSVFIIPTFQRPFAWEKDQLRDLREDIEKTNSILSSNPHSIHYLAPIHLIKITPNLLNSTTNSLNVKNYLSEDNKDIKALLESVDESQTRFIDLTGNRLNVYFVIDGQQRLTTLFFVYQFLYTNSTGSNPLFVTLKNGNIIPRLIQNPSNDHQHFKDVLNSLKPVTSTTTQAQKRMNDAVKEIDGWTTWNNSSPTSFTNFLRNPALRTLLVELDPIYGLTSFQTLNGRGKDLTSLDKFKSLLFEYDLNYNKGSLTHDIHIIFSKLYQMLDEGMKTGLFPEKESDDRLMKYIFTYIKIEADSKNYDHSGERAYDKFRDELQASILTISSLLTNWLDRIQEVYEQLQHLNDCLSGNESTVKQPSFICPNRTIQDDYNIIIRSLSLSDRSIAVLIKFRALHNVEWHDRFSINCTFTPSLFEPLKKYLNECRGEKSDNKEAILKQIDELRFPGAEEPYSFSHDYSMLQVVERMELLVWKRFNPAGTFHSTWLATFNLSLTDKDTVQTWYGWYSSQQNDFPRFVQNDTNDSCFRYVLREYECYLGSGNIHFDPNLTLEHIFPQNPNPKPPLGCGFVGGDAYNLFLNRIGNLTFVYQNANMSNQLPQIKAGAYYIAPTQPQITQRVGKQLKAVGINCSDHHQVLLVRCTELALFSIKRFFC